MEINPQPLQGHWKEGFALDIHTLSSTPKEWKSTKKVREADIVDGKLVVVEREVPDEVTKWDTTYTPIGLEMNHLKYWSELYRAERIGVCAADFLKQKIPVWAINLILPIPPSDTTRNFQPVFEIVKHIGKLCNIAVDFQLLKKLKPTSQLKQITEPQARKDVLAGAFAIENNSLADKNVLIFDDLYRSGETLNAVCDVIINQGKAKNVYVLTITKTRSKR